MEFYLSDQFGDVCELAGLTRLQMIMWLFPSLNEGSING